MPKSVNPSFFEQHPRKSEGLRNTHSIRDTLRVALRLNPVPEKRKIYARISGGMTRRCDWHCKRTPFI
jgi:hypothetical protein